MGGMRGVVGIVEEVLRAEESVGFGTEEIVDFALDEWSDGGYVGHGVVIRGMRNVL